MTFRSILFQNGSDASVIRAEAPPDFFRDLNLDRVVDAIISGREEYDLRPFFYCLLDSVDEIAYRHEVMRDLHSEGLADSIRRFSQLMRQARGHRASCEASRYPYQRERLFLHSVESYCAACESLLDDLDRLEPASRGLIGFREFLRGYVSSESFSGLVREATGLAADLSRIRYGMLVGNSSITVSAFQGDDDFGSSVEALLGNLSSGTGREYLPDYQPASGMSHIDAEVLKLVARLNPRVFQHLLEFCGNHGGFAESIVTDFDREIQLYLGWLEHAGTLRRSGLEFCFPEMTRCRTGIFCRNGFDMALAAKLMRENKSMICNDFALSPGERIMVVTGPNQGGKTTFARAFGQILYLARLGFPVPGEEARLFLFDRLFTHFARLEDIRNLHGRLEDDLFRTRRILDHATGSSVIIMNEAFSSTALGDAVHLSREILGRISRLDAICVWVTFIDTLADFDSKTVSMVAGVDSGDSTIRTYRIERRQADGVSYALALAGRHGLTREAIVRRLSG